jgi:hypothetical protein
LIPNLRLQSIHIQVLVILVSTLQDEVPIHILSFNGDTYGYTFLGERSLLGLELIVGKGTNSAERSD